MLQTGATQQQWCNPYFKGNSSYELVMFIQNNTCTIKIGLARPICTHSVTHIVVTAGLTCHGSSAAPGPKQAIQVSQEC